MQQLIRCTLVKLLRVGRDTTENHRWSLVSFFLTDELNRCLKAVRSLRPATGRILSTTPSSSSTASQRLHKKKNLDKDSYDMTALYVIHIGQYKMTCFWPKKICFWPCRQAFCYSYCQILGIYNIASPKTQYDISGYGRGRLLPWFWEYSMVYFGLNEVA